MFLIWESSLLYFLVFYTGKKKSIKINKLLLVFLKNRGKHKTACLVLTSVTYVQNIVVSVKTFNVQ